MANRSDVVFFFGDLNYRVQPLPDLERHAEMHAIVLDHIQAGDYNALLQHDQLRTQQRNRTAFYGYSEGDIAFAPTFKLTPDTPAQCAPDLRYSKKRVPAYCDRVLWRALSSCPVRCQEYSAHPDVTSSDHTPVTAVFGLTLPSVAPGAGSASSMSLPRLGGSAAAAARSGRLQVRA